ncbi:hypothetical protein NEOLI_001615 [Neolecta irregularis DAH-3]|uniref:Uncharacterized protein n=1 Tax=Neolecta irregularis (strain DAH-3) TaxID=1198029 RepID=A0A1U7LR85_NEOID|nr:hypothetical protein NEOLI_001615 [Neolecta irregularis DAH-3]|eukprot:OLL25093.1 hypothetical protein NEOLI_001615 [Neolecta irregularis DAH-3]
MHATYPPSSSCDSSNSSTARPSKLNLQLKAEIKAAIYCRAQTINLIKRLKSTQTQNLTCLLQADLLQLWKVTGIYYAIEVEKSLIFSKHGICVIGKKTSLGDELKIARDVGYLGPCEETFRRIINNLQFDYSVSEMKQYKKNDVYALGNDRLTMSKMVMGAMFVVIGLPLILVMGVWGGINGRREFQKENRYWIEQARDAVISGDSKVAKIIQEYRN